MPKLGRKDAGVDGILHVADETGEAGGFEPSHGGIPGLQALSSESFSPALTRRKVDCMTGANRTLRLGWPLLFLTQMGLIIWRRLPYANVGRASCAEAIARLPVSGCIARLSKTQPSIAGKAKDHPLIDPKALGPSQGLLRVPPRRQAVETARFLKRAKASRSCPGKVSFREIA